MMKTQQRRGIMERSLVVGMTVVLLGWGENRSKRRRRERSWGKLLGFLKMMA
jgi:hypothetical protein